MWLLFGLVGLLFGWLYYYLYKYYDDIVHSHCGHSWLTLLDVIDGAAHLQCVNALNNDLHIERDFPLTPTHVL